MDDQLKQLVHSAQDFRRPGHICQVAARVLVPLWHFKKAEVWATKDAGPQQLDKIFLGLLHNGIASRKEIAARLGVDEDEFIFAHLDELVRAGYVADNGDACTLTPQGEGFFRGQVKEERMEKVSFPFVWGDMSGRIEPESIVAGKSAKGRKLKHNAYPPDDDLISALAEYFNKDADSRERKLTFYDAAYPAASRRFYRDKTYAEYVALFYAPAQGSGDLITDLRVYDKNEESYSHFRLCEELSDNAKEDHWRKQFAEIYEKENAVIGNNSGRRKNKNR